MNLKTLSRFSDSKTGFFRYKLIGNKYLITNDFGAHMFLDIGDFRKFVEGTLPGESPVYAALKEKGYIKDYLDFDALVKKWKRRNNFLWQGPSLHIIVLTLRCNYSCVYCQSSSKRSTDKRYDMTKATARSVVDRIFDSPSPVISIEFQGGEPLQNWPTLEFIVDYARKKNKKAGKTLLLNLVTNLADMNRAKLNFLMKNDVNFCTSLDGPRSLHNKNRVYLGGDSYANTIRWWKEIKKKTSQKIFQIDALLTVTRESFKFHREIVAEYARLGARGIFLRFLSPLGMAKETWDKIGYTAQEFLEFYRKALDCVLEVNIRGKKDFFEQTAKVLLMKIFTDTDPNFLDLRSPCGGGIGQIAYNYDGKVFTCDEGRMLHEMGDDNFCMGDVRKNSYKDIISHPAVKCLVTSSCTDSQTSCSWCVYKPYCGVCPILNYVENNDLFGHMPENTRCKIYTGILDTLFEKLQKEKYRKVFESWVSKGMLPEMYRRN